jgi:hypothetical protein
MIEQIEGIRPQFALLATAELYDPAAGTFMPTSSSMTSVRWFHTATLLTNGKVLLAGGRSNFSSNVHSATAELFDPFTNTFAATGSMTNGRDFHTATLLPSGDVMVAGGNSFFSISSVELYTPTSGTFTGAASLSTPRHFHTASLLPDGKAVLVGGIDEFPGQESPEFSVLWSAELFDPNSNSFLFTGSLGTQRFGHAAALLNNGQILVTGGSDGVGGTTLNTAELYR